MADLVGASEVEDFPGAPYPDDVLTAAGETVRRLAGWHIAPPQTDTIKLDSDGGRVLWLPSRKVTALVEVRDVAADTVITGVLFEPSGRIYSPNGFPCGCLAVQVQFTHGFTTCPAELLPVVASFCLASSTDAQISQESLGSWSQTLRDAGDVQHDPQDVLGSYTVSWGIA